MAPDVKSERDGHDGNHYTDTSAAEAALKARLSRKRTKTGCLTCRKRRIKCDEERPICKNCIKSKRHCEGYNQRVIFKPPAFDYHNVGNGSAHFTFQAGPVPVRPPTHYQDFNQPIYDPTYYSHLHPRPVEQFAPGFHEHGSQQVVVDQYGAQSGQWILAHPQERALHLEPPLAPDASHMQPNVGLPVGYQAPPAYNTNGVNAVPFPGSYAPADSTLHTAPPTLPIQFQAPWQPPFAQSQQLNGHPVPPATTSAPDRVSPASSKSSKTLSWNPPSGNENLSPAWTNHSYVPRPELCQPIDYQPPHVTTQQMQQPRLDTTQISHHDTLDLHLYEYEAQIRNDGTPTYFLTQAAVETQDDDYYDVHSEEEMELDILAVASNGDDQQRNLHRVLRVANLSLQDVQTRRYDTFINGGALNNYSPEEVASPLKHPATARVFAHFISVTGPSLSIFERHPRSSSVLFNEGQVPVSQQGIWTYTMPMLALRHQGLLHAMLALASLQIARLTGAAPTPSMQHYMWALKRVHRCVSNPKKRSRLTTIAASMLLGFYEVMTADHMKWNTHLSGSKQLFLETDFVTMTQQFKRMKADRAAELHLGRGYNTQSSRAQMQDDILDSICDVDERVISELVGKEIRYGNHGHVMTPKSGRPSELDLNDFEILKDLYWWYLKQDVYQSIVSGNPLLLDYSRWADCPPRAPLGKGDAVYGSFDHLVLLLGRVADFASRDRARKLKQMEANGGQWRPAPGTKMSGAPAQAQQPPTPMSATNGQSPNGAAAAPPTQQARKPPPMPQFFGMAPPPRLNVQMPSSYRSVNGIPTPQTPSPKEAFDLEAATHAALEEYGRIRAALHAFSDKLNRDPDFRPLTSEYQDPIETSFGTALFYRSMDIGCLWMIYHMAMIIIIRSNPGQHPAAHVAAAIAASDTAPYAKEIGRIAAGVLPGPSNRPLNPTIGAALCESCMPSFFAAIQYQDAQQRRDTVTRIYDIARRTGWGSAELIARGCETSWVKAADAGRGPPYTRIVPREQSDDPRLNGSWERLDPNASPDEQDEGDRRLIRSKPTARLNWAIGVMGTSEDENAALMR